MRTNNGDTEDRCCMCIYQGNPEYCYHCIRQYSNLPDRFSSSEPFFEDVPENQDTDMWPDNLYKEVKGINGKTYTKRPKDVLGKTEAALKSLGNPREAEIIRLRFERGMTLRDIGKSMGVTAERVRQVQHKALRKLRHPSLLMMLEYGEGNFEYPPYKGYSGPPRNTQTEIGQTNYRDLSANDITALGLSLRTCLALKKAGINTISELSSTSKKDLLHLKGIGSASVDNICEALRRYNAGQLSR